MSPVLDIKDLSVAYRTPGGDVRAASHVNLTINKGEVVCEGNAEFLVNDPQAREIYLGPEFNM